jgi:hypothetical protein
VQCQCSGLRRCSSGASDDIHLLLQLRFLNRLSFNVGSAYLLEMRELAVENISQRAGMRVERKQCGNWNITKFSQIFWPF